MRLLVNIAIILMFSSCVQRAVKDHSNIEITDSLSYMTVVLQVNGMTCEGCENTIVKSVGSLEGIKDVSASYLDSFATVVFDTSFVNTQTISEKINELGYEVKGVMNQ
ncbi:hypothetical protein ES705_23990 [subsurface metagenome]